MRSAGRSTSSPPPRSPTAPPHRPPERRYERSPGSEGAAGAPGAAGAAGGGGWQSLLAEILGGAAVGAVGALFGDVAGAALQGAAEPLVRRAADWVAARRHAEEQVEAGRPVGAGGVPEAAAVGPDTSAQSGAGAGAGAGPRALGFADLVALTAQIADLCGVRDHLRPRVVRVRSRLVHRPRDPQTKVAAAAPFLNSLLPLIWPGCPRPSGRGSARRWRRT
ncbi:hypothetical protein GCM10020254_15150 [Streptomyces goshikiensis]